MENLRTYQILFCSIFFTLVLHSFLATSQEVENQTEFDYVIGGERGPDRWGFLRPEWRICKNGTKQSPIDLMNNKVEEVPRLGLLRRFYRPSIAVLKNRGHDIMLKWKGNAGYIEINGTQYAIRQCHWHSPSEHTIDGQRFDLEAHLVHETPKNQTAVVGLLYTIGRQPDPFLSRIERYLRAINETQEETVVGLVNPSEIGIEGIQYYRYNGSLTIPPCSENVTWTIVKQVKNVSREQVKLLRTAVLDGSNSNARPLQPINNRTVELFRPSLNPKR